VTNDGELMSLMIMNTIGMSILCAEFKHASWVYFHPRYNTRLASDSLAFIQGTGLEIVVHTYHLMYDPNELRNVFFSMVGDHAKIS